MRTICAGDSLLWRGRFYSEWGVYSDTLNSTLGCDSIITLDLKIDTVTLSSNWELDTICLEDDQVLLPDTVRYNYSGLAIQDNILTASDLNQGNHIVTRVLKNSACVVVDTQYVWVDSCIALPGNVGTTLPFIEALPTLNNGQFRVYLGVANTNNYTVRLIDRIGRVVGVYASEAVDYMPTLQEIDINAQQLSNGLYYMQLITDDQVLVAPIEIIR